MRTLKFIVDGQILKPDPNCDFGGLVPGTDRYLQAEFVFSYEWSGFAKVAAFYSAMGSEYPAAVLADGTRCNIPAEALVARSFKVKIIGKGPTGTNLTTNKITVTQKGDKT
jgi:hypothetical protein